ncbi:MAG TPA: LamG-like jellyroll fold domain-containing protein [Candidatus Acidoferrales bacterium]|jgi:ferric-dicitrate binding protein FerR (iron transport regulator)|nr:LamG-like jellyroll fold domain-containing protein [Candidatus Acidoferrales bacterium]
MNDLTDKEILALHALCNAVIDGNITEKQKAELSHWLLTSRKARQYYIRTMGLSASLYNYASEMQAEAPDVFRPRPQISLVSILFRWLAPLGAAAAVVLGFWLVNLNQAKSETPNDESVAQITASKECQWAGGAALVPGARLHKGQEIELTHGFAEVTFDSGARVLLEGPTKLEVDSAWAAVLKRGTLKANVPHEAIGFNVVAATVSVVDLGTEFTMIADATGATDLLVLKGAVEASPQNSTNQQSILLHTDESLRFGHAGVSGVDDSKEKFARYTQSVSLDHFAPPTEYVHWSFDETDGKRLHADASGIPMGNFDLALKAAGYKAEVAGTHVAGRWQQALDFDGRDYAKAAFPGLSGNSPRTVAFWVKIPTNAQLSDAYAMVAWRAESKKFAARPVHICWNRNPAEGTIGVLRTDYGGGFALGTTSLRDGNWHHIAVAFVPGENIDTPVQVKQYVDGRLEGEGYPSPPGEKMMETVTSLDDPATVNDTLWLGCRLGLSGPRKDHFRGTLDELFIANRALEPREIVELMKNNQPLQADPVAVASAE